MSCIMKGCPNTKQFCKSLRFFTLPIVPEWRKKWLDVCRINRKLVKHPLICSEHFSKEQMYMRDHRVTLRRDAVPTPLAVPSDSESEEFDKKAGSNASLPMNETKEATVTTAGENRCQTEYAASAANEVETEVNLADEALDYLQNKIQELTEFQLALDDAYDVSCGEIFITLKRVLVFHCSLCNQKYASFAYFLEHLSAHHYKNIKENVNKLESVAQLRQELKQSGLKQEEVNDDMLQVNDLIEFEIKPDLIETEDPLEQISKFKAENESDLSISDKDEHNFEDTASDLEDEFENIIQKKEIMKIKTLPTKKRVADFSWAKGVFPCKGCSKTFDTKKKLNRHTLIHSEDEEESFDDKAKDEDYKEDIPIERKKVKKKRETSTKEVSERINKPKKPKNVVKEVYTCKECEKKFTTLPLFNRHILTHSGVRQHICKVCSYAFKFQSSLKYHMRRHTNDKNISCGICPKMFFTNPEAREHRRIHTGERPFVCFVCGLAFTTSGALTIHERKHNDEPLFKCSFCGKGYPAQCQLNYHMVMHTKERPFSCSICSATFPRRKSMLRHIQILHEKHREEIKIP